MAIGQGDDGQEDRWPRSHYRHAMLLTGRNGNASGQAGGNSDLVLIIETPAHDGAVALQTQTMEITCGNSDEIAQIPRWASLARSVIAPADDQAVGLECKRMIGT